MRRISWVLLAAGMLPLAAQAQDWKAYSYPEAGFAFQLPVAPDVEHTRYTTPAGASLPMTRYTARQDGLVYTLDIIDYSRAHANGDRTIAESEKSFGAAGKVTVAIDARINREWGRELSVNGADGSRSAIALFFVDGHLFRLEGKSLPPDAISRSGNTIRFQESLQFIGANGGFGGFGGGGRGRFGRGTGAGRFAGAFNPQALAVCQNRGAGDAVQLDTPRGSVAATCTLVARPIVPPDSPAPAPAGVPN